MKFSVIIPAYNEERYIEKVLLAISGQTYRDYEIVVVDNASTDGTYKIASDFVSEHRDAGIVAAPIIVMKEDQKGTMAACEKGRSIAKGDIIARLDADCLPDRDWLEKASKIFEDQKVVALSGPYDFYDADDSFRKSKLWQQKFILTTINTIVGWLGIGALTNGGNSMFRASVLEEIGGFDTSIEFYGDDTNIAKRMSKKGWVVFSGDFIMKTSARRFEKGGDALTQMKYVYHFIRETLRYN